MSKEQNEKIFDKSDAVVVSGGEQKNSGVLEIKINNLNIDLEKVNAQKEDLAHANANLFYQLQEEKKKMPRAGKNIWAFSTAVLLSVGGYFMPAEPLSCCGASLSGNLYQVAAVILLLIIFAGPFALRVLNIFRVSKGGEQ